MVNTKIAEQRSRNQISRSVWSAWSLLPLSESARTLERNGRSDSASKLDALHTLREVPSAEKPSQPESRFDPCSVVNGLGKNIGLMVALLLLVMLAGLARAAELSLKVVDKEPPKVIDDSIRTRLQSKAVQLLDGDKPAYEFWFSTEFPFQTKPASLAKALDAVNQTTLLGAVSVSRASRDYKDNELAAGIYTMRLGFQPQDGDHLGTSDFVYFAVLIPAKNDAKLDGITTYKALTKASGKETASGHPVILSLRPASSDDGELPKLVDPAPDHKAIRVKLPAKVAGNDEKISLVFDLVYKGAYKK